MIRTALIALTLFGLAGVASARELGGNYRANGTNFDGSPYSGTATISITSDTTCEISWVTGSTSSTGFCMRNQDAFAASYAMGETVGLVIYKIMPDGSLNGIWTIAGKNGAGTEVLTPQ
jgi:hypothetical protein